jgi:hypothetical protein
MNPSFEMIFTFEWVGYLLVVGVGNIKYKTFDYPNRLHEK